MRTRRSSGSSDLRPPARVPAPCASDTRLEMYSATAIRLGFRVYSFGRLMHILGVAGSLCGRYGADLGSAVL